MTPEKILEIKRKIAREWANDPVKRAEDIFRIRKSDGSLVDLKVPESQKEILRKGILRKARKLKKQGLTYRRVVDKGRQIGFSIILAVEAIMIAQDYPNTFQYYIAVRGEQAESWLQKVEQIVKDAKHWPDELGGGPILTFTDKGLHNKMTKVINDCTIQGLTANPAGLRGDCLLPDQIIYLSDGSQKTVKDLKTGDKLVSINLDNKQEHDKIIGIKKQPLQDLWFLETRTGKQIKASYNHPILTPKGWVPIHMLQKDDYVAMINNFENFGDKDLDINIVKLVAYLIGDGSYGRFKDGFGFSNNDDVILKDFFDCCFNLEINYSVRWKLETEKHKRIAEVRLKTGKKYNEIIKYMKNLGMYNKLSDKKEIPKEFFSLKKELLKVFIQRLMSTDGWLSIDCRDNPTIGYSTTSVKLAEQVSHLFLRFGILNKIRHSKKQRILPSGNLEKVCYSVNIIDKFFVKKYLEIFGWWNEPEKEKKAMKECVLSRRRLCGYNERVPFFKEIKKILYSKGLTINKLSTKHKIHIKSLKNNCVLKSKIIQIQEKFNIPELNIFLDNDIDWVRVKKVSFLRKDYTIGLETEKNHNFVVSDFYTHNTAINVILDEFAWMITKKNQQDDTYSAIKYFLRQGGQLTAQSTPRVSNDLFWKFYDKGRKLGFEPFYKPVIENWKDLDLHSPLFVDFDNERRELLGQERLSDKDIGDYKVKLLNNPNKNYVYDTKLKGIRQDPIIIPYPWVSLVDLEIDREQDLEIFMQENLGVPVDERYKLIIGDWIYPNQIEFNPSEPFDYELNPGDNWPDRGDSYNSFYIGIDWASKQDLTAITILEKIGEDYYERYSDCLSGDYEVQHSTVCELIKQFKPVFVAIDYTSEKSMGDRLEKEFGSKIKKVVFSSTTKAHLATNLKNIARRNNYHVLNFTRNQQLMVKHMLKVEKKITDTTTKYSGKDVDKEGRDDGFWSKSLAAYDSGMPGDKKMVQTSMAFGTSKAKTMVGNQLNSRKKLRYEDIIKERNKKEETVVSQDDDRLIKLKEDLSRGLIICNHKKKPIKSYECLCVDENGEEITTCKHYNYHKRICEKYGFTLKEAKKLLMEAQK